MLQFNDNDHTVSFFDASLTLQPLSYLLLKTLAEKSGEIISSEVLIESVWGNTQVSQETLKQRVFILRKAINESELKGISIEALRSHGYRVRIRPIDSTNEIEKVDVRRYFIFGVLILIVGLAFNWYFKSNTFTPNNRVILWSNIPTTAMDDNTQTVFEKWRSVLSNENKTGRLQLIMSDRIDNMLVSQQARANRAGLISHFELISVDNSPFVRLSIVEPTTATVLRSDSIDVSDKMSYLATIQKQQAVINRLIDSNKLCLTNIQRNNSQDSIWQELRAIANQN